MPRVTWFLSADSIKVARGNQSPLATPAGPQPRRQGPVTAAAYFGSMLVSISTLVALAMAPGHSESCGVVVMPVTHGLTR
jgi:hypothetical protein